MSGAQLPKDDVLALASFCEQPFIYDDLVRKAAVAGVPMSALNIGLEAAVATGEVKSIFARRHSANSLHGARMYVFTEKPPPEPALPNGLPHPEDQR